MKKSWLIFLLLLLINNYANAFEKVIIILGQPGAGKGTQSQMLGKIFKRPVLAASNILRSEALLQTKLGTLYNEHISHDPETRAIFRSGLMMQNIAENNATKGLILEGWPNSSTTLNTFLMSKVSKEDILVVELFVPDEILLSRINHRKQCFKCGASYGLDKREKRENMCDVCQQELTIRKNDNVTDFKERLMRFKIKQRRYHQAYREHGIEIRTINAEGTPDEVHARILSSFLKKK